MDQAARGRRQWLLAVLLPALLMALVLGAVGIRYHTNDDATLANIAAGAYGPDRVHLVYVNILFGWLLRPFYALAPGVNWYVAVQLGLILISAALLCRLALRRFGTMAGAALFLAGALPFLVPVVYLFHYVKTGGLCLTAGLLWLAAHLGQPLRKTWPGLALALLGSLLRWELFVAVGGLSAALLLGRFFKLDPAQKRRAVGAVGLLLALAFAAKGADVLAYRLDDGWRAYRTYNAARMAFSDYKVYFLGEENPFAAQGLSDNDYQMLCGWDFYDHTVFPAQRVAALAAQVPGRGAAQTLKQTAKTAAGLLHGDFYRYIFGFCLLACLLAARWDRRSLPLWGTLALFGAELVYLIWRGRFPAYVEQPMVLACGVFAVACAARATPRRAELPRQTRALAWGLALAVGVASGLPTLLEYHAGAPEYRAWAALERDYFTAMSADPDHLYLLSTLSTTTGAGLDVWRPWEADHFSNIVFFGGWLSHAPHREAALAAYGLTDPLVDAVDNDRVYLDYHNIDRVVQYVSEHLDRPVRAVQTGPNEFAPYQLVSIANPKEGE